MSGNDDGLPAPTNAPIASGPGGVVPVIWQLWFDQIFRSIQKIINSGGGSGSGNPAPPNKSVQFNKNGVFGGDANLLYDSGTLTITTGGTSFRFKGDMSSATIVNRFAFQTSTVNGPTRVHAFPNGTGTTATFNATNLSDPTNANFVQIGATSSQAVLSAGINGAAAALPFACSNNTVNSWIIDTAGNFALQKGLSSPVVSKTANYTVVQGNSVIFADCTSGNITLTLPAANIAGAGFAPWFFVKRIDSSTNTVSVVRAGADTIDGGTTFVLGALQSCDIVSDGVSAWGIK
jgi:hypothetical protein